MPKILMACHAALLLCLSLLGFPSAAGVVPAFGLTVHGLAIAATGLAVVLYATEMLSGLRWTAGLTLVATIVGLAAEWGRSDASAVSAWAWVIAWCAVVAWFARLALQGRENR